MKTTNTKNSQAESVLIYSIITIIAVGVTLCALFGNNLSALN